MSYVLGTFKTRIAAEDTIQKLEAIGVEEEQLSLVVTDETRGKSFNIKTSSKTDEGLALGATAGGTAGAILGTLATASAIAIPGLNLVVVGTAVSALAGLGAGAATGGLLGALIGSGIPEHEAKIYEDEIKNGSILLAVSPKDDEQKDQIKEIFENVDAYNIAA